MLFVLFSIGRWVAEPAPLTVGAFCLIAYLLLEAAATHEALGLLRHELLKEAGVADFPSRQHVRTVNG
jgi:hypothetical protein